MKFIWAKCAHIEVKILRTHTENDEPTSKTVALCHTCQVFTIVNNMLNIHEVKLFMQ